MWGGAWGCCGWDDVDIDRNVNINRNNVYNRWDQRQVRSNLESRAQNLTPQQRQEVQQRAQSARQTQQSLQGRAASGARSNDVYAGRDGNAYRRGADGWERNTGQGWRARPTSQAAASR